MKKKDELITSVIHKALTASLAGLFAGLTLGLMIWAIMLLLATDLDNVLPREVAAFLGMGIGTVIGALFGGFAGLKGLK